jgi:toxin ParE1/3/4
VNLRRKVALKFSLKPEQKRDEMRPYKLTGDAKSDLKRIYARGFREYGEEQAERYFNAFFDHFEQLAEQPFAYPAVDHIRAGYRRITCGNESIYYRIRGGVVEVMAIIGRQDVSGWL